MPWDINYQQDQGTGPRQSPQQVGWREGKAPERAAPCS